MKNSLPSSSMKADFSLLTVKTTAFNPKIAFSTENNGEMSNLTLPKCAQVLKLL